MPEWISAKPQEPSIAKAGGGAAGARVLIFGVLLALLPARLSLQPALVPIAIEPAAAFAEDGEGDGGGHDGGESDGGGHDGGESDGGDHDGGESDGGGNDGGESDGGGESHGGDDGVSGDDGENGGKNDGGDHGVTGSSLGGFLGALMSRGRVASAEISGNSISVTYSDGWTEEVSEGQYQLFDRKHRVVISRQARSLDVMRLRAAAIR